MQVLKNTSGLNNDQFLKLPKHSLKIKNILKFFFSIKRKIKSFQNGYNVWKRSRGCKFKLNISKIEMPN